MVVDDDNRVWLALRYGPTSYPDYDFGTFDSGWEPAEFSIVTKRAIGLYTPDTDKFEFWLSENHQGVAMNAD